MRQDFITLKVVVTESRGSETCKTEPIIYQTKQSNVGEALRKYINKTYSHGWTIATYTMSDNRQGTLFNV